MDPDGRTPIFLQLKEANEGALARHAGRSEYPNHGQRVVVGQRLMQAASDIFLVGPALVATTTTYDSSVT